MQDILALGARRDARCVQLAEGKAEYGAQMLAPQIARPIDGDVDVRAVIAVEHHARDQTPAIVGEAEAAIRLHGRRLELAHHPFDDGVVRGRVVRIDDFHMSPPGI